MDGRDEYITKAMLLGMKWSGIHPHKGGFIPMFKKRIEDAPFRGCAIYCYYNADTLEPLEGLKRRSEIDQG
jgi:hypothetical protein